MKDLAVELLELEARLGHCLGIVNLTRQHAPEVPFEAKEGESSEELLARYQAQKPAGLEYCLAVGLLSCPKMFLRGPDPHQLVAEANEILDGLDETKSAGVQISWGTSVEAVLQEHGIQSKK